MRIRNEYELERRSRLNGWPKQKGQHTAGPGPVNGVIRFGSHLSGTQLRVIMCRTLSTMAHAHCGAVRLFAVLDAFRRNGGGGGGGRPVSYVIESGTDNGTVAHPDCLSVCDASASARARWWRAFVVAVCAVDIRVECAKVS